MKSTAKYYTPPPDLPPFIYRRYPVSSVSKLIAWSKKEYNDALRLYAKRGDFATVRLLSTNYSPLRLLAEYEGFKAIVAILVKDSRVWNSLSWRDRVFIRRAYEMYEMLRKAKLVQ